MEVDESPSRISVLRDQPGSRNWSAPRRISRDAGGKLRVRSDTAKKQADCSDVAGFKGSKLAGHRCQMAAYRLAILSA